MRVLSESYTGYMVTGTYPCSGTMDSCRKDVDGTEGRESVSASRRDPGSSHRVSDSGVPDGSQDGRTIVVFGQGRGKSGYGYR